MTQAQLWKGKMNNPIDQMKRRAINIGLLALVSDLVHHSGADMSKTQWRQKGDSAAEVILWPSPTVHTIELIQIGAGPERNTYYVFGTVDGREVNILSKDASQ
jgi:hypothetical protein